MFALLDDVLIVMVAAREMVTATGVERALQKSFHVEPRA